MPGLNKVILLGNLTRDPQLRRTSRGTPVCALGLAMNRKYTTAAGESREETCFVDIDVWGRQAESCSTYLRKGSPALVEGRLRLDQWEDRETGKPRSRLKVTAEQVQFLSLPRGADFGSPGLEGGSAPEPGGSPPMPNEGYRPEAAPAAQAPMPVFEPIDEGSDGGGDPIPF